MMVKLQRQAWNESIYQLPLRFVLFRNPYDADFVVIIVPSLSSAFEPFYSVLVSSKVFEHDHCT